MDFADMRNDPTSSLIIRATERALLEAGWRFLVFDVEDGGGYISLHHDDLREITIEGDGVRTVLTIDREVRPFRGHISLGLTAAARVIARGLDHKVGSYIVRNVARLARLIRPGRDVYPEELDERWLRECEAWVCRGDVELPVLTVAAGEIVTGGGHGRVG